MVALCPMRGSDFLYMRLEPTTSTSTTIAVHPLGEDDDGPGNSLGILDISIGSDSPALDSFNDSDLQFSLDGLSLAGGVDEEDDDDGEVEEGGAESEDLSVSASFAFEDDIAFTQEEGEPEQDEESEVVVVAAAAELES